MLVQRTSPFRDFGDGIAEAFEVRLATKIPHRMSVEVRVVHGHHAVFATVPFRGGETVLEFDGVESSVPGRLSIQVGRGRHLFAPGNPAASDGQRAPSWPFLNHSCSPNASVRGRALVALDDIPAGAEVTFDYNTTEWEISSPFECWCGHASCVGLVRGYRWLSDPARKTRLEITSSHLLDTEVPSASVT